LAVQKKKFANLEEIIFEDRIDLDQETQKVCEEAGIAIRYLIASGRPFL